MTSPNMNVAHGGRHLGVSGASAGRGLNVEDNDALREEVRRLQLALVDKFRGKNKMIGGSQFRISPQTKKGGQNQQDNRACGECVGMRNMVKSLRTDNRDLKSLVSDLQRQVATAALSAKAAAHAAAEAANRQQPNGTHDGNNWEIERIKLVTELEALKQK